MLSFLLQIRDGDYSDRYRAVVAEVMTMLQLEDSWVYQAGTWKGEEKGLGIGILTVLNARGLPVSEPLRQQILSCGDIKRLTRWLARAATAGSAEDVVAEL